MYAQVCLLGISVCSALAGGQGATDLPYYWVTFPKPAVLYITPDMNSFPPISSSDSGGVMGDMTMTLQSLAGLAAKSCRAGSSDAMIWMDMPTNASYAGWLAEVFRLTKARRENVTAPFDLLKRFHETGIVKGYIVYDRDMSKRNAFDDPPKDGEGYDNSINVATSLSSRMDAVIVEAEAESVLAAMGLKRLMDVRGKDEGWLFETRRDEFPRDLIQVVDPKVPHMRDYAVAAGLMCVFGVNPVTDKVYAWMDPGSPIPGWNGGDEYVLTSQMSRNGHFNTASNWIFNMPVLSTVRAGDDIPVAAMTAPRSAQFDPIGLDWPDDTHFTSFMMSDGDNVQWYLGNFFDHPAYWGAKSRGSFPMTWTTPVSSLTQIGAMALLRLAQTASPNDCIATFGAGYYYPDEFGKERPERDALIAKHVDMFAGYLEGQKVRVLALLAMDWKSPDAIDMYKAFAKRIHGLAGIVLLQYYPYNAGKGEVLWVEDADGHDIPVLSARYSIWAGLSHVELNGPPALVADYINKAPYVGAPTSPEYFDWTVVHAWSSFKEADTSKDLMAEEIAKGETVENPVAGFEAARDCVDRLASHVRVVGLEELLWRMRLALRPAETLDCLAGTALAEPGCISPTLDALQAYREWLATTPDLSTPSLARAAYAKLQDIRFGRLNSPVAKP